MARVDTIDELLRPLMAAPSIRLGRCAVCGRAAPLNQHHMVRRSAGRMFRDGVEVPKPTITLCGLGNHLADADGRPYCHGLAHANRLHFRWVPTDAVGGGFGRCQRMEGGDGGHLEYILLDEPASYARALEMGGWRPLRRWRDEP